MFGNDQITEAYLLRADPYWHQKWEELRKSNPRDMKAGDVPKFKMQGVEQCWHCKHRDGSGVHHVNGHWYRLPYCKVCDADMTIIYEPPCREFEAEEGE